MTSLSLQSISSFLNIATPPHFYALQPFKMVKIWYTTFGKKYVASKRSRVHKVYICSNVVHLCSCHFKCVSKIVSFAREKRVMWEFLDYFYLRLSLKFSVTTFHYMHMYTIYVCTYVRHMYVTSISIMLSVYLYSRYPVKQRKTGHVVLWVVMAWWCGMKIGQ